MTGTARFAMKVFSSSLNDHLLVVGNGRVARHLCEYFKRMRMSFETWNRRENSVGDLRDSLSRAGRVLVLLSDTVLEDFFHQYHGLAPEAMWIHCSGALEISGMESFHPLMTFGPQLYTLDQYVLIPFVTTSHFTLAQALPGLSNPCVRIPVSHKARYHALCVLSGNFTTILWRKLIEEFRDWNLSPGLAKPFAQQVVANVFSFPDQALTGPLVRRDLETQAKNLAALDGDPFADIYRAFQNLFFQVGAFGTSAGPKSAPPQSHPAMVPGKKGGEKGGKKSH
ncbi:MAG: hypothetical protein C5B49_02150 [Bdellovibrio sp.]|nr:MAG: hypothetical protein C5B49_02150 [Bdellovibrio sp.]